MIRLLSFATATLLALFSLTASAADQPNVVLIFIDDMGYGDVGFNGAKDPETPHLDRMAKEGRVFDDFYVGCAVCSGSRTALMTGCHYRRLSMAPVLFPNSNAGLHPDEVTLAEMLKGAGYRTACVGKWHLGHLHAVPADQPGLRHPTTASPTATTCGSTRPTNMAKDDIHPAPGPDPGGRQVLAGHKVRNQVPLFRDDEVD